MRRETRTSRQNGSGCEPSGFLAGRWAQNGTYISNGINWATRCGSRRQASDAST